MWEWAFLEFQAAIGAPTLLAAITQASLDGIAPGTLARVRGWIHIVSDQAAASEDQSGAFGVMVVKETARAAGVASLPTPITEGANDDWQTYVPFAGSGSTTVGGGRQGFGYEVDSKAMRKFSNGDAIVVTVEQSTASNGFNINGTLRLGFKLH